MTDAHDRVIELLIDYCGEEECEESGLIDALSSIFDKLPIHNPQPQTYPEPLDTKAEYTNDELSASLLTYTGWGQFWSQEHALVTIAYRVAKERLDQEMARQRNFWREQIAKAKDDGAQPPMAKADIDDEVKRNAKVLAMQKELTALNSFREIAEAQQRTYDKFAAAVSRVIEIRKMDFDNHQRENRASLKRSKQARTSSRLSRSVKGE